MQRKTNFLKGGVDKMRPTHGRKRETLNEFNQLTIIGFIGKDAETKQLPNRTPVTKFSVATTKSWKDNKGDWKDKTQWHHVLAFASGFAQTAERLTKGTHVFAQGELTTREYDGIIQVPNGKKTGLEEFFRPLFGELVSSQNRIVAVLQKERRCRAQGFRPKLCQATRPKRRTPETISHCSRFGTPMPAYKTELLITSSRRPDSEGSTRWMNR